MSNLDGYVALLALENDVVVVACASLARNMPLSHHMEATCNGLELT